MSFKFYLELISHMVILLLELTPIEEPLSHLTWTPMKDVLLPWLVISSYPKKKKHYVNMIFYPKKIATKIIRSAPNKSKSGRIASKMTSIINLTP
jgi:hypothetical protein